MTEIINLRRVKKARERAEVAVEAAAMRARHGRTREERLADDAARDRLGRALDGAKLAAPEGS